MTDVQAAKADLARKAAYDSQYAAAHHILTAPLLAANARVWRHVDDGGIDFEAMLAEGRWSTAERLLLTAAASLFGGPEEVSLRRLIDTLSPDNLACVFRAMRTYAGGR